MSSPKHEAFVRLSEKRLEAVEEAIRIWSNLSGPSYEFTIDEVMASLGRISAASTAAQLRFSESKCWRDQQDAPPEPAPIHQPEPEPELSPKAHPPAALVTEREAQMLKIWDEIDNEEGALLQVLAMQREVIANLQANIERKES